MLGLHSGSRAELFRHESGGKGPVDPRLRRVVVRGSGGAHGHVEGHEHSHNQHNLQEQVVAPRHITQHSTVRDSTAFQDSVSRQHCHILGLV